MTVPHYLCVCSSEDHLLVLLLRARRRHGNIILASKTSFEFMASSGIRKTYILAATMNALSKLSCLQLDRLDDMVLFDVCGLNLSGVVRPLCFCGNRRLKPS